MSGVSSSISSLTKSSEPYSAKASINNGIIDPASSTVTGDRNTSLFNDAANKLGKDDFLLLLVTQLQYQDPLSPMENTEFISQLAQFSSLENSTNVVDAISEMNDSYKSTVDAQKYSAQSMNNAAAVSLIGKDVCLKQTTVNWYAKAGETAELNIHLGDNKAANVSLLNAKGEVVRKFEASDKDSENSATFTWDGTTDAGTVAPSGTYTIQIEGEKEKPELYAFKQDVVDGVRFTGTGALVKIAGQEITVANVLDVSSGSGSSSGSGLSSSSAVSLLGKQVRTRVSTVQYNQATTDKVAVNIAAGERSTVQMQLTDSSGNVVYSTSAAVDEDGIAHFEWNGQQSNGTYAKTGTYSIRITGEKNDPSLYAFDEGVVSGITNLNGDTRLKIGSSTVKMSSIIDISEVEES